MSVPSDRSDSPQSDEFAKLKQESAERLLRGLDYFEIILEYGEGSEEARNFVERNPNAVTDRKFFSDVIRDVFDSPARRRT